MRNIFTILALFAFTACARDIGEKGCWEITFRKATYECDQCGMALKIDVDTVFVKCDITQNQARDIILALGGIPDQKVEILHEDETETRITSSYKPVYN
jgi:hypothetical protein